MNIIIFFRVFRICLSSGTLCEELWHKSAVNPGTECVPQFSVVSSALSVVSSALYVCRILVVMQLVKCMKKSYGTFSREFRHTMGFFLITHKFVPQLATEWMERKVECTENYRKNMSQTNSIAIKKYFSTALYEDPIEGQNNLFMRLSL